MGKLLAVVWVAACFLVAAPIAQAEEGTGDGTKAKPKLRNRGGLAGAKAEGLAKQEGAGRLERRGQGEGQGLRMGGGLMLRGTLDKLGLTEEQKKAVEEVFTKLREETKGNFEKNAEQRKQLFEQLKAAREAKDEAKIKELHEQLRALAPKLEDTTKTVREQVKGILTEEQNKKLDELLAKVKERREAGPAAVQGGAGRRPQGQPGELMRRLQPGKRGPKSGSESGQAAGA